MIRPYAAFLYTGVEWNDWTNEKRQRVYVNSYATAEKARAELEKRLSAEYPDAWQKRTYGEQGTTIYVGKGRMRDSLVGEIEYRE